MSELVQVLAIFAVPTAWLLTCRYFIRRQNAEADMATMERP